MIYKCSKLYSQKMNHRQNQLAEEIKQRKRKAIDLKYNKEDECNIYL